MKSTFSIRTQTAPVRSLLLPILFPPIASSIFVVYFIHGFLLRGGRRRQEEVSKARDLTDTSSLHCYTRWIPESGSCACPCVPLCVCVCTLQSCFLVNELFKPIRAPNGAPVPGRWSKPPLTNHANVKPSARSRFSLPFQPSLGFHNCQLSTGNKGEAEFRRGLIAGVCSQSSSLQRDL